MKNLPIIKTPNRVLEVKAKKVVNITPEISTLIADMKYTLRLAEDPKGVGLAAPQVGKSLQLFIIREDDESPIETFINPVVKVLDISTTQNMPLLMEGCLSIGDMWGMVGRASKIKVSYKTAQWKDKTKIFEGFKAIIIQHEFDHIQGILFTQRVREQQNPLYKAYASNLASKKNMLFRVVK